ncbi:MAG: GntR family transcriptional regulator [Kineothrix sp.]|nr:GntR family transcriptional regulator [Kineothrix sp.]
MERKQPKYMELVNWIQEQIAAKKFLPGQKMYSENRLKEMFHVSRQTIRHAIGVLEEEGVLVRRRGSGTYISNTGRENPGSRTRIAVVTTYVDSYIFPKTIQGIENVLSESGYSVQIAFTNNHVSREKTILEDIIERDEVAGVIVETTKSGLPNPNLGLYGKLLKRGIPVIFINSYYPGLPIPHVSLDDRAAGVKAVKYLLERGHKKIGGVFKMDDGQGHMRYAGYLDAMQEAGIEMDDSSIVWLDTEMMQHLGEYRHLLMSRLKNCTAAVCYNDQIAFEAASILNSVDIRVPEDISIVSIDDSELAMLGDVALTSIPHPKDKLGEKAAHNLLKMIRNPSFDGTFEFGAEIVERESVKTAKGE